MGDGAYRKPATDDEFLAVGAVVVGIGNRLDRAPYGERHQSERQDHEQGDAERFAQQGLQRALGIGGLAAAESRQNRETADDEIDHASRCIAQPRQTRVFFRSLGLRHRLPSGGLGFRLRRHSRSSVWFVPE